MLISSFGVENLFVPYPRARPIARVQIVSVYFELLYLFIINIFGGGVLTKLGGVGPREEACSEVPSDKLRICFYSRAHVQALNVVLGPLASS